MPNFEIDINFNVNSEGLIEAEAELHNISNSAEEATSSANDLDSSISNVDGNSLEEVSGDADSLSDSLKKSTESSNQFAESLDGMKGLSPNRIGLTQSFGDFGSKVGSSFDSIGARCDKLGEKFSNLSSNMGSIIAGIGLAEMATSAWEGATEKQTNQILLARKYGTASAEEITNSINSAVTKTPGDDAFLTSMLSNASLKAKMTKKDLDDMASSIADYQVMSKASGSSTFEAQGEIRNYLMTGETGRMKDSPLAPYLKDLEGADTVTERVKVLNDALNELGYSGASGMSSAANSMETFSGTMQNALTQVGMMFLPIIQSILDKFLEFDDALGGNLSKSIVIVGGGLATIVAGAGALGAILPAVAGGFRAIGTGIDILTKGPQIIKGLISGFQSFQEVITLVREAESLSAGINAAYSASLGAEAVAADTAGASTGFLASMEWSALIPILLVVGAIALLIGALWYLYNNNETVRQSIDWLIQQFQLFVGGLLQVGQTIASFVSNSISAFLRWVTGGGQASTNLVNAIYNALVTLPNRVQSAISGITRILTKPFTDAWNTISPLINRIGDGLNQLNPTSWFGAEYEGVQYEGFNGNTLNGVISSSSSNSSSVTNNFNINGIIEEEASQYIVNSVNDYVKKQNLIRGV